MKVLTKHLYQSSLAALVVGVTLAVFSPSNFASENQSSKFLDKNFDDQSILITQSKPKPIRGWQVYTEGGFHIKDFNEGEKGFSLNVVDTGDDIPYGIQVLNSCRSVKPQQEETLKFAIKSNKDLPLTIRIGEKEQPYESAVEEYMFIPAGEEFKKREINIPAKSKLDSMYCYFQFGQADPNTNITVQDITVQDEVTN